jgi:large subunit ribosomal protein L25
MTVKLVAAHRSERGKNAARTLRRTGRVPAVIYGRGDETRALSVDALELEKLLASVRAENTLIDVEIEGAATRALIREVQRHPYRPEVLHVDFLQIHAGERLKLDVPIRLVGAPIGVREEGGVLQQALHELHIECLPRHIPDAVEIEVDNLAIGDSIHVRDVLVPNVSILNDVDLSICSVVPPTVQAVEEEPEVTTEVEDVEPELVGRPGEEEELPEEEPGA